MLRRLHYCLLALFLLLVATVRAAEVTTFIDVGPDVPALEAGDCNIFLNQLFSSDVDSSNGVSESEYHSFLVSIEDPTHVAQYFADYPSFGSLPWVFRVVHKSLACHCQQLGLGDDCCKGKDAEISLLGLDDDVTGDAAQISELEEYRVLVCQQIAFVLAKSVPNPMNTTTSDASANTTTSTTTTTTAEDAVGSQAQVPNPNPADMAPSTVTSTSNGDTENGSIPNTTTSTTTTTTTAEDPVGSQAQVPNPNPTDMAPSIVTSTSNGDTDIDESIVGEQANDTGSVSSGIGAGGIIGIILAVLLCCIVCCLVSRNRERFVRKSPATKDVETPPPLAVEEHDPKPQPKVMNDDEDSVVSEFVDDIDDEKFVEESEDGKRASAGSALAAIGAASNVAINLIAPPPAT